MIDQPDRMQGLMCHPGRARDDGEVYERVEESELAGRPRDAEALDRGRAGREGLGHERQRQRRERRSEPTKLEGWLDAVLDELATPQKRPFGGMGEAQEPEAPKPEIAVVEETPAEGEPEESAEPEVEEPAAETPAPEPPAAKPKKKRRRFFGF